MYGGNTFGPNGLILMMLVDGQKFVLNVAVFFGKIKL
jgi:hypothetical protein